MHGRKRNRNNTLYWNSHHRANPNYTTDMNRRYLPRRQIKQPIQSTPVNYSVKSPQIKSKSLNQKMPLRAKSKEEFDENNNYEINNKDYDNLKTKINDIKQKITQEIESRKQYLKKKVYEDSQCFKRTENGNFKLEERFINYLLKESDYSFLKKIKVKKRLRKIRFNLKSGDENVLIYDEGNFIFGSETSESLLEKKSTEWKEWKELIDLIGNNMKNYKFSLKKAELDELFNEYEKIRYPKKKENTIICEKCGSENSYKAVYCHYCGYELNKQSSDDSFWD